MKFLIEILLVWLAFMAMAYSMVLILGALIFWEVL